MNKATETTENKKVYQFPVNKETYDAYVEDKASNDNISNEDVSDEDITFETDNENNEEIELFKELFISDLDDLDDEVYEVLDDELTIQIKTQHLEVQQKHIIITEKQTMTKKAERTLQILKDLFSYVCQHSQN